MSEMIEVPGSFGGSLSVGLELPTCGTSERVPVVLTCDPYRKEDFSGSRHLGLRRSLTGAGIAHARLDVRGTGASGGRLPDREYSDEEVQDCIDVLDWLKTQPWCSGRVAMWGMSWGANIALRVLASMPRLLDAAVIVHGCTDLGRGDIHLIDGALHLDRYHLYIELLNSIGAGPTYVSEEDLRLRFDTKPWLLTWLAHVREPTFWGSRSVCADYSRVKVPLLVVGGWFDGYRDTVFDLLNHSSSDVEAVVGPWDHVMPEDGGPGPALAWLGYLADWLGWRLGLSQSAQRPAMRNDFPENGTSGGVRTQSRRLHYYANGSMDLGADSSSEATAGIAQNWCTVDYWPLETTPIRYQLRSNGSLMSDASPTQESEVMSEVRGVLESPATTGVEAGHWWGGRKGPQSRVGCLCFESGPLEESLRVFGQPEVRVRLSGRTRIFIRMVDIDDTGQAMLMTGGGYCHDTTTVIEDVTISLRAVAWQLLAGHRLGLWISTALWPLAFPGSMTERLMLHFDGVTELLLPTLDRDMSTASGGWLPGDESCAAPLIQIEPSGSSEPCQVAVGAQGGVWTWEKSQDALTPFQSSLGFSVVGLHESQCATGQGSASVTVNSSLGEDYCFRFSVSFVSQAGKLTVQCRRELYHDETLLRSKAWLQEYEGDWI